ncbi:MAG: fimbria/pilus periplasmic chaperone [Richelia sp. RM2_1_2]|nr:fimbria/pilus periplasmic chaperone [Richelia sp. SM2_1_7]NJM17392.1 fimbria/pilus periplasmic chaperone [Richelia sp. SM1_7_0]NJN09386.1 fimbria/pilus periplasmic chaperone [Richelia sp. RM1_1_1]NJO26443.1 fimbria/pilus periplasmic chaperone [Richelia sp. SL_2_1]NJO61165.1 fimbria/pilus periplasmic chaperone [Richelia sp. RM2_1_2]
MLQKTAKAIGLSLIALLTWGIPSVTALEMSVSPPRMELDINSRKGRTNTIKITNFDDKPVQIRAYVQNWTMDEKNQFQEIPSTEQSLDQWILFTPSKFTIPAKGTQTLRFAIRPKIQPNSGEHRAVIYFEEIVANTESNTVGTKARIGVVVYAYSGEIKRIGNVNSVSVDTKSNAINAVFDISNKGNAHIRMEGQYAIWQAAKYPGAKATQFIKNVGNSNQKLPANVVKVGSLKLPPILPNQNPKILQTLTDKLPPGNYVLDINAELSGIPIQKGIPFTVKATANTSKPTKLPVTSLKGNRE